jgi:hypothetical protein
MSQHASLADRAVEVLAAVARMDEGVTNEHDERHHIRTLKRLAEEALTDAFRNARQLAYLAEDMRRAAQKQREGGSA